MTTGSGSFGAQSTPQDENAPHPLAGDGYVGAIDLGGTKILAAIFGPDGTVVSRAKKMTRAERGPDVVHDRMVTALYQALDEAGVRPEGLVACGVGVPGPVDTTAGIVKQTPNLPGWVDLPLRDVLADRIQRPVAIGNDVSVAVLAEHAAGAGRGVRQLVGIWPGTGVGGGLVINGEMYYGTHDLAGEIGHMTIKAGGPRCGCGGRGHLEALCSRTAIVKEIAKAAKKGAKSPLIKEYGKSLSDATSGDLARAVEHGDAVVIKALDRAARFLALGIASVANLLNPEMIVLGGGVIEALGQPYVEQITGYVRTQPFTATTGPLQIVQSELGDDAGITGAALLARRAHQAQRAQAMQAHTSASVDVPFAAGFGTR